MALRLKIRAGRISRRAAAGRAQFQESLHPRGAGGKFADKPDAPASSSPGAGKASSRPGSASIPRPDFRITDKIVLRPGASARGAAGERLRAYGENVTIEEYINRVGNKKRALQNLYRDMSAGRIRLGAGPNARLSPSRQYAPHPDLRRAGVRISDVIVDRSGSGSRELGTISKFLDEHPSGPSVAIRTLASQYKSGGIGIRKQTRSEARQVIKKPPTSWPGMRSERDLSGDSVRINKNVLGSGLFKSEADVQAATRALTAGIPQSDKLKIKWSYDRNAGVVSLSADGAEGSTIKRNFQKNSEGTWSVEHERFELPEKYQGGGNARRMLRSAVETYDGLGVSRIVTYADIDVGGYAWARMGFVPAQQDEMRLTILSWISRNQSKPGAVSVIKKIVDKSSDDDLLFNIARARSRSDAKLGKKVLMDSHWFGYLDLSRVSHRKRLGSILEDK